jgi:WD40 repeat protein
LKRIPCDRPVVHASFSPDGREIVALGYTQISIWEAESGRLLSAGPTPWRNALFVTLSPDQTHILAAERRLGVWERRTGRHVAWLTEDIGKGLVNSGFSSDGRYVLSPGPDWAVRLFDWKTGQEVKRFEGHTDIVKSAAVSPDGTRLISTSSDKTLRLWDVATGRELNRWEWPTPPNSATFLPGGRRVVFASARRIVVFDLERGAPVHQMAGHQDSISGLVVSPDGRRALSAGSHPDETQDPPYRLWDLSTGRELFCFELGAGVPGRALAFSPQGDRALFCTYPPPAGRYRTPTLHIWRLPGADWKPPQ